MYIVQKQKLSITETPHTKHHLFPSNSNVLLVKYSLYTEEYPIAKS